MAGGFGLGISLAGMPELLARLEHLAAGAAAMATSSATVLTQSPYARYVHDGTRAHQILPNAKKALYWPGAAHPVRSVQHPGTRAQPFLTDALTAEVPRIEAVVGAAAEAVANGAPTAVLGEALWVAADLVLEGAVQRVPVKTGALRQSLHTEQAGLR